MCQGRGTRKQLSFLASPRFLGPRYPCRQPHAPSPDRPLGPWQLGGRAGPGRRAWLLGGGALDGRPRPFPRVHWAAARPSPSPLPGTADTRVPETSVPLGLSQHLLPWPLCLVHLAGIPGSAVIRSLPAVKLRSASSAVKTAQSSWAGGSGFVTCTAACDLPPAGDLPSSTESPASFPGEGEFCSPPGGASRPRVLYHGSQREATARKPTSRCSGWRDREREKALGAEGASPRSALRQSSSDRSMFGFPASCTTHSFQGTSVLCQGERSSSAHRPPGLLLASTRLSKRE